MYMLGRALLSEQAMHPCAAHLWLSPPKPVQQGCRVLLRACDVIEIQQDLQLGDAEMAVPLLQMDTLIPLASKCPAQRRRECQKHLLQPQSNSTGLFLCP